MKIVYLTDQTLSTKAQDLVNFDIDSIRQAVTGNHANQPSLWAADPKQYEHNGRVLRDSNSPRLLAYSQEDKILYANDGCNSCTHPLTVDLQALTDIQLRTLAGQTKIPTELLERIAAFATTGS